MFWGSQVLCHYPYTTGSVSGELIQSYYDKFGDRFCCFGDLKSYVTILTPQEASQVSYSRVIMISLETDSVVLEISSLMSLFLHHRKLLK